MLLGLFLFHSPTPSSFFPGFGSGFRSGRQVTDVGEQADERRERAAGAEGRSNRLGADSGV